MAFHLSHTSAADFWRLIYSGNRAPSAPPPTVPFASTPHRTRDLRKVAPDWLNDTLPAPEGGRVHILVPDSASRSRGQDIASHVWGHPLPEGAFYQYSADIFISSPAFTFLQMAKACPLPQLIAYGNELCGLYAFDLRAPRGFHMRQEPLITAAQLAAFLENSENAPGAERARRALMHVGDNAESPMETVVMELLSLPYRHGGYGIPGLLMNQSIPLSPSARKIAARRSCRADISSADAKIDIEFQGKHDHAGSDALNSDRRRTNALTSMGYDVVELTNEQVRDLQAFEEIALMVAKRMGRRIDAKHRGALPARRDLRKALFAWNAAYGRMRS